MYFTSIFSSYLILVSISLIERNKCRETKYYSSNVICTISNIPTSGTDVHRNSTSKRINWKLNNLDQQKKFIDLVNVKIYFHVRYMSTKYKLNVNNRTPFQEIFTKCPVVSVPSGILAIKFQDMGKFAEA